LGQAKQIGVLSADDELIVAYSSKVWHISNNLCLDFVKMLAPQSKHLKIYTNDAKALYKLCPPRLIQ